LKSEMPGRTRFQRISLQKGLLPMSYLMTTKET
jgi:hypothetical protein